MSTKFLATEFSLKDEFASQYHNGIKNPCDFRVGVEVEKIGVMKNTFEAVPYIIMEQFLNILAAKNSWQKIKQNNYTIGLQKDNDFISLEPGSQMEISLSPKENIHQIAYCLEDFNRKTSEIADLLGFHLLGYGIQPVSTYDQINIIPKPRYHSMTDYFFDKGDMAYVMMRETAGTQINLDYSSEEDAINKLRLGLMLAPIVSAMFSNSPIRGGQNTGYKSFRANSWLYTDNDRCGFINEKLFNPNYQFTFNDYVETLLDVPMIFVMRGDKPHNMNTTFRNYLKDGYDGLEATISDWDLHSNLYFPEVRLKSFLEFRNADSQSPAMALSLMALYKGVFYDETALKDTYSIFENRNLPDLLKMRYLSPKYALDVEVGGKKILDIAKELIFIAKKSLQKQFALNESNQDESIYLLILEEMILSGKTPADNVLGFCSYDIQKLIEYTKI
ncbi:MAG: glutamate-cysteine ligase family protein [bacterium]